MIRAPIINSVIRPTTPQRVLAYLRTGSLPPVLVIPALALEAALSFASTVLCLAAGYMLGSAIAP